MSLYRKLVAGALCAGLFSATGIALVAAQAETLDAGTMIPARPAVVAPAILPTAPEAAQPASEAPAPAAPAEASTPAPVSSPAPGAPAARRSAASGSAVDAELACLAKAIVYEAGSESRAGQLAVAQVIMNRVRSPRFPNTICGVVHQRGQFASIRSFRAPRDARWTRALAVARDAREGVSAPVVGNALFFHAARARPFNRVRVARLGGHIFYR